MKILHPVAYVHRVVVLAVILPFVSLLGESSGSGLQVPRLVTLDAQSVDEGTSEKEVRCRATQAEKGFVVVEIRTRKGCLGLGINAELSDQNGSFVASMMLQQFEEKEWMAARITMRDDVYNRASFPLHRKDSQLILSLKDAIAL
jgi:hypothetical protein